MQQNAFLFIKRNWAQDETILTQLIDYYSDLKMNTQVRVPPGRTPRNTGGTSRSPGPGHRPLSAGCALIRPAELGRVKPGRDLRVKPGRFTRKTR